VQTVINIGFEHVGYEPAMLWCIRHGLDPNRIAIPNTFVVDDERRTVTVMCYFAWDKDGRTIVQGDEIVVGPVTVQLESPALPWQQG
jgi:hypothetical protein